MPGQGDQGLRAFISWQKEYDCQVTVINHQHQDVLDFINQWYGELREIDIKKVNVITYMRDKFRYLDFYSKYHLSFEEKMLVFLAEDHGFPLEEYERHLNAHRTFMKNFMSVLGDQFEEDDDPKRFSGMEFIVIDSLRDVAKWWFNHIRTPSANMMSPPDHIYRTFMQKLAPEARAHLLNRIVLHFSDIARGAMLAAF